MSDVIKINGKFHALNQSVSAVCNIEILLHAIVSSNDNQIDTDADGLKRLGFIYKDLTMWIRLSQAAIGELLGQADHENLSGSTLSNVGWLISGLAELQFAMDEAGYVLKESSKGGAV